MNPNKALWEKGDFTQIADTMRESGTALVAKFGITKGLSVLDLGCGDGNTALPEAKLGANVLGVDIASNLVEAAKKRAKSEGLTNCIFQEGDATNLHELKDQSFDLSVSIFGAMFAPKPLDVAREEGWKNYHGQLDTRRPHACCSNFKDQLVLYASAT
jgi:ubiquinone/menaquinone biosynthesis C-methylase UbiE